MVARPLAPSHAALAVALAALALPALGAFAQSSSGNDVVVIDVNASGTLLNVTVSTYSRPLVVRSAGLAVDGSLVSNEVGGVSLSYGRQEVLSFHLRASVSEADLRIVYEWTSGGTTKTANQTIRLDLGDFVDVRPVDAFLDDAGNVTIRLHNFGQGTAEGLLASLRDEDGAMIGVPYYREVPAIGGDSTASVSFFLARATDAPRLVLESGGASAEHPVFLRAGTSSTATASGVSITTDLPSLSGAPGATVPFTLQIKNTGAERTVALATNGLPDSYTATFAVQGSGVQTVRLAPGQTRTVSLSVTLPAAGNQTTASVPFEVIATTTGSNATTLTSVGLEISPSGAARLTLSGRNWFADLEPGGRKTVMLSVKNDGSAMAHDVELSATAPSGWDAAFQPRRIEEIAPGDEVEVELTVRAPSRAAEGRYVVDVGAQGGLAVARDRSLTVEVAEPTAAKWPWLLAVAAVGAGAVWGVIRIRRR